MGASSRRPEELSREELEEEVVRLRNLEERVEKLETLVGTLGDTDPSDAALKDVTLVGNPIGILVDKNCRRLDELESAVQGEECDRPRLGGDRDEMLPAHRMYGDLKTGADHSLNATQKRAARIFGQFVERVVGNETNLVDASGQMYSLTSGPVEEILLGKHDEDSENLLKNVKKASRSQVIARAMRDVARLSKLTDCECAEIDDCTHTSIRFRSGRPNKLGAPKQSFKDLMRDVYNDAGNSANSERDSSEKTPVDENPEHQREEGFQ